MDWKKFKNEIFGSTLLKISGILIIVTTILLIGFVALKGLALFTNDGYSIIKFLFGSEWKPDAKNPSFGSMIFTEGSILVSLVAILIATPLALCVAIYSVEISKSIVQKIVNPFIEILIGVPSVVYGWVGLSLVVPFVRNYVGGMGFSLLSGGIVLAVMIFPTITSVSIEALKAVNNDFRTGSLAIGATKWQTIRKIVIPTALPGILTGVVLGLARAFGEALAVQMVIGNTIATPKSPLDSMVTLTSIITMDMGNTTDGSTWNNALWSMALLLLVVSFIIIILLKQIGKKRVD